MTIELKLDTNALSSLIEQDGEFKLKLQQCILENIARRHVKGVDSILTAAIQKAADEKEADILKEFGTLTSTKKGLYNVEKKFQLSSTMEDHIAKAVREQLEAQISEIFEHQFKDRIEKAQSKIYVMVANAMSAYTDDVVKKMIKDKFDSAFNSALNQIKGA